MIGIVLTNRREEFYKFASEHPLAVKEIFDTADAQFLSSFTTIYTDGPAIPAGPYSVIDISKDDFSEVFKNIAKNYAPSIHRQHFLDYSFEKYQDAVKCIVDLNINFDNLDSTTEIKEHKTIELSKEPIILDNLKMYTLERNEKVDTDTDAGADAGADFTNLFEEPQCRSEIISEPEHKSRFKSEATHEFIQTPSSKVYNTDLAVNKTKMPIRRTGITHGVVCAKGLSVKKKIFQVPVFTFTGLTDKAGTSTLAASLAVTMAIQQPSAKILYLDLDMSNPNFLLNFYNMNPNTDACVKTIAALSETEFMNNISLLTDTVSVSQAVFSLISWGQMSFSEKRVFASQDFSQFITNIYNSFDLILVDMGKLQSTLDYQIKMLASSASKHFIIADGSSSRTITTFVQLAKQLPYNFEVIVNKDTPQSGSFSLRQQLRQAPIASISLHRNIDRILEGQIPIQGTALYNELCELGGRL